MVFKRGIKEIEAESDTDNNKGVTMSSKQSALSKRQRMSSPNPSHATQKSTGENSKMPLKKSLLQGVKLTAEELHQSTLSTEAENEQQNANTAESTVDKIIFISALGLSPKIINEDPARTRFRRARERRRRKATKLSLLTASNSPSPEMIWNSIMKKEQVELDQNTQMYPYDKFENLRSSESKKTKPTASAVRKPRKILKHENALALPKSKTSSLPRRSAPLSAINSPIKLEFPETSLISTTRRGRPRKSANDTVPKFDTNSAPATVTPPVVSENELPPPSLQKPKGRPRKGMERLPLVRTPGSRASTRLKDAELGGSVTAVHPQKMKGRPKKRSGKKMERIRSSSRLLNQNVDSPPPRQSKQKAENNMKIARLASKIRARLVPRPKPKPTGSKLVTPKKSSNRLSAATISDVLNQFGKVVFPPVIDVIAPPPKARGRPKRSVQRSNSADSDESSHLTKPNAKPVQKKARIVRVPKSVDNPKIVVQNVQPEMSATLEPAEPQPKPPPKTRNRPKNLALARLFMGPPNQKRTRNHLKK